MTTTTTPVLGLTLPVPGTAEPYNRTTENSNLTAIDSAIGVKTTKYTTTTVQNTTTETSVFSTTVPANPVQGSMFNMKVWGTYDNSASAANFVIRAKIGGTTVASVTITTPASAQTNSSWLVEVNLVVATTGVSGTWRGHVNGAKSDAAGGTTKLLSVPSAATTKDTTASNALEFTVQWSAASASNVIRCDAGITSRLTNA
jgi:hypothetical protein